MPSKLQDYDVIGIIGSGSYGTCKKIRRKSDGKVMILRSSDCRSVSFGPEYAVLDTGVEGVELRRHGRRREADARIRGEFAEGAETRTHCALLRSRY